MDRTLLGSGRVEVRGGALLIVSGEANAASLAVGSDPRIVGRKPGCHLVLTDKRVSATHCELVATEFGVRLRDLGSTNGTHIGGLRVGETWLHETTILRCGDTVLEFSPGKMERVRLSKSDQFGPLVGAMPRMRAVFDSLRTVAPTTLSVLIEGETGTGKELVARAIHDASDRAAKPFVVVDCAAIPANLAESTLFGHERGSFTGATERRKGALAEADGGTVFLDELGELPLELQPKLLRVLADQRLKRVGSDTYAPIDIRVVAATRRNLLVEINRGTFRDDLYFRIAEERIELPPLRDRREDIPKLVQRMMAELGKPAAFHRASAESLNKLLRHFWPGNVRELRSVVKSALAYDHGGAIDLAARLRAPPEGVSSENGSRRPDARTYADSLQEHDRDYFARLFEVTEGNISEISRRAGVHRATVRESLARHGIKKLRRRA